MNNKILISVACLLMFFIQLQTGNAQSAKLKKANELFNNFAYIDAIKLYEEIAGSGKLTMEIAKQLAEAYRRIGNSEQSEIWYKMVIDLGSSNPVDYYYYSEALKSNKKYKESEKWIAKFKQFSITDSRMHREIEALSKGKLAIADSNTVEIIRLNINSKFSDFSPVYYNNKIMFASAREKSGTGKVYVWDKQPYIDLYTADKAPDLQLSNVQPFSIQINTPFHEGPATFNESANIIYFTRNNMKTNGKLVKSNDKTTNLKIYMSVLIGGLWSNNKEFKYNSNDFSTGHPTLSRDGSKLYFASDRPGGYGQADIYVCVMTDGVWSEPKNMSAFINTEGNEMFPFIHSDGTLYFASDGLVGFGGLDIYAAIPQADGWWSIVNMGYPLNSPKDDFGLIIDDDSQTGYYSSNRNGGEGFDDIYAFKRIGSDLLVSESKKQKQLAQQQPATTNVVPETNKGDSIVFDGKQIAIGESVVLPNIYYDLDKWFIRHDADIELQKVIDFMKKYPDAIIELSSHTDCRASFKYNMTLSQKRAESAVEFISKAGINKNRMVARGYGETKLINKCADGAQCSEQEHQMNRRTEVKILSK